MLLLMTAYTNPIAGYTQDLSLSMVWTRGFSSSQRTAAPSEVAVRFRCSLFFSSKSGGTEFYALFVCKVLCCRFCVSQISAKILCCAIFAKPKRVSRVLSQKACIPALCALCGVTVWALGCELAPRKAYFVRNLLL